MTNKRVYSGGFPFPCALTGIGSGFSALAAALVARAARVWFGSDGGGDGDSAPDFLRMRAPGEVFGYRIWWTRRPQQQPRRSQRQRELATTATTTPPPTTSLLSWVLPVAVFTALSMALGNFPYLYLSVSFIQMLKASSPAWTLLLAAAAGLETPTAALAGAVALIAAGTAATVLFQEEAGGGGLSASSSSSTNAAFGVVLTLLSCVSEAARVVGSQALLQKKKNKKNAQQQSSSRQGNNSSSTTTPPPPLNALESLVYVGAPASLLLLLASRLLREGGSFSGLFRAARSFARTNPTTAIAAIGSSAAVNFASMAAVRLTSSLTFKVSGCAKNAAVMALAAAEHGDTVTRGQVAGYCLATSGFVAYAWVKARGGGQVVEQGGRRRAGDGGGESNGGARRRRPGDKTSDEGA
jgi:drug/metabolite transporter (DMT)-like permease